MDASNANAKTLTIDEISAIIEIPAKTIRKVLRANSEKDAQPGRGKRWAIRETDIEKVRAMMADHKSVTVRTFEFGE